MLRVGALATALLLGCAGRVVDVALDASPAVDGSAPADTDTDTGTTITVDAREPDIGSPVSVCTHCPSTLPIAGAPCPYDPATYLLCTYGSDPIAWCRSRALCGFDGWRIGEGGDCRAATCPATPMSGAPCSEDRRACAYDDGTLCVCVWGALECTAQPPGCPTRIPNAGDLCTGEVKSCGFPSVTVGPDAVIGVTATCEGGCFHVSFASGK
jgi:hypothetical protein